MRRAKRTVLLMLVLLVSANSLQAQRRWTGKPKHWYKDAYWLVGEGVIAAVFALDAHSTVLVRERCPGCRETNALLGPYPTNRAIALQSSVWFAFETALHIGSYKTCYCHADEDIDKPWLIASYLLVPAINAGFKLPAAISNYELAARHTGSPPAPSALTSALPQFRRSSAVRLSHANDWRIATHTQHDFIFPNRLRCDLCNGPSDKKDLSSVTLR